jgi:hypothetical protein
MKLTCKTPAICLLALFWFTAIYGQAVPMPADEIFKGAYRQASTENKNVFIIFHASWCGWCRRMDSLMNSQECKDLFLNNYVVEHLVVLESTDKKNLENPGAMELLTAYHGDKQGIPFWLILDKNGKLIADSQKRAEGAGLNAPGENTGCPATPAEIAHFIDVLKQTSTLNSEQLAVIAKKFGNK